MNPGIAAARKLVDLGYRFEVNGESIKARYEGEGGPDPSQVRPLLALVKEHKAEVKNYLARRPQAPERVLSCFECPHFRPAVNSPSPTQAFGRCEKRKRGRYGVATGCEALMHEGSYSGKSEARH